jgi:uncharacterized protein (DUF885 family)
MRPMQLAGLLLLPATFALCLTAQAVEQANNPVAVTAAQVPNAQLRQLVDEYFVQDLALNPLYAPAREVNGYNSQFGDYLSDDYLRAQKALESKYLARAQAINRQQLSEAGRVTYDAFVYSRQMTLKAHDFPFWLLPVTQEVNKANDLAMQASGDLVYPFDSTRDYQDFLARLDGFSQWVDRAIARMQEGGSKGIALPRELADATAEQLQGLVSATVTDSQFYLPVKRFPESISAAERERLSSAYADKVEKVVNPALTRLANFLRHDYQVRKTLGWSHLPNGQAWYQYLSDQQTTSNLPVEEIFTRGEAEVARIQREMEAIRQELGFKGNLQAFFHSMLNDPQYMWSDSAGQLQAFNKISAQVDKAVPKFFSQTPKTPFAIKPIPPAREDTDGSAWYSAGSPDGKTPGVFFVNTKPGLGLYKWEMETTFIHEAVPGHHFQISMKQEQQDSPKFRQFLECNGFEEGWALYVESIGGELGLETDPLQRFGKLNSEMLRAMRMVVEPGLHVKNWSIAQAQQYMQEHSALTPDYIEYEVLRYLANPGQALSYKVGQLTISDLRSQAQAALGDKFDLRLFHDNVINTGTLPLAVLSQKSRDWIDTQR